MDINNSMLTLMDKSNLVQVDLMLSDSGNWVAQVGSRRHVAAIRTSERELDRMRKRIDIGCTCFNK
jgi:hypothetical protein